MSDIANSRLKSGLKEKFSVSPRSPSQCGRFALLPIMELKPDPSNPRKHGREQIRALARSVEETSRLAVIQRAQKSRRRPLSVAFCVLNVVLDVTRFQSLSLAL